MVHPGADRIPRPLDHGLGAPRRGGAFSVTGRAQRRLPAALLPPLWAATSLAAVALLFGVGLRRIARYGHRLEEELRPHLSPRRSGWVATILCVLPLMLQWGLAASACSTPRLFIAISIAARGPLGVVAFLWFWAMPGLWMLAEPWIRPVRACGDGLADQSRATGGPDTRDRVARPPCRLVAPRSPEIAFAQGLLSRRKGDLRAAAESFRAAAFESSRVAAHAGVNLGNLRLWADDPTGAAQQYELVLDAPNARLEARYNLAIALSRLHRFREADERLDEASRLDLARVRAATRTGDPQATIGRDGRTADDRRTLGRSSARRRTSGPGAAHRQLASPGWTSVGGRPDPAARPGPGWRSSARSCRRRLRVHDCHHCGSPICRRCVTRGIGHAYCPRCAASLGGVAQRDYDRILLRRLLGEEKPPAERARWWATHLVPGVGLIARGRTLGGAAIAWCIALGVVLATRAAWSFPPSPAGTWIEMTLRSFGVLLIVASYCISSVAARRLARARSVRLFFERDTYQAAA